MRSNTNVFQIFRLVHSQHFVSQRCLFYDSRIELIFPVDASVCRGAGIREFGNECIDFPDNPTVPLQVGSTFRKDTREEKFIRAAAFERAKGHSMKDRAGYITQDFAVAQAHRTAPIANTQVCSPLCIRKRPWQIFSRLVFRSAHRAWGHSSKIFTLAITLHRELCYLLRSRI